MLLTPLFITLLLYRVWFPALVVFVIAAVTDAADGYFARRLNQKSTLGRVLDPVADKLLMVSTYVVLAGQGEIPVWLAVVVASRDVLIVGGVVVIKLFSTSSLKIEPSVWGKATTFFQILTVVAVLGVKVAGARGRRLLYPLYVLTSALTCVSGYLYVKRGWESLNGNTYN